MSARPAYLPADQRRAEIIDAVVALAAERNPDGITTAAIAERLGLTQGALFRHFPTKQAIWASVMGWVADTLLARLERAAAGQRAPLDTLEALFGAHVAFVVEHPGIPRMLFGELQNPVETPAKQLVQTLLQRYAERLVRLVEAGRRDGTIAAEIEPRVAALLFIGSLQGLVMQSLLAGDVARMAQDAPRVFAQLRRSLLPQP